MLVAGSLFRGILWCVATFAISFDFYFLAHKLHNSYNSKVCKVLAKCILGFALFVTHIPVVIPAAVSKE